MRLTFKSLVRVQLRHSFYKDGRSVRDFSLQPSPATLKVLQHYGVVFRQVADGFALYAQVESGDAPHRLMNSIGNDTLRLTFLLHTLNPYVLNISALPVFQPGRSAFYFNNLRDDQGDQRLHLGDSVMDARVGDSIEIVAGDVYTHQFAPAVRSADITMTDMFGTVVHTESFQYSSTSDPTSTYRIPLQNIPKMVAGRYVVTDNHSGSQAMYYDPEFGPLRPFGIVEIFNRTDRFTPANVDVVPNDYRFLDGDELTGVAPYIIQFDARSTRWVYNVMKQYDTNSIPLQALTIVGDLAVTKDLQADRAVFTTNAAEALREIPRSMELHHNGAMIKKLPSPQVTTPLQEGASPNNYVSELFVYV